MIGLVAALALLPALALGQSNLPYVEPQPVPSADAPSAPPPP